MTMDYNALTLAHEMLAAQVKPGDFCIDATAGRGFDAAYLAALTGETGRVLAFDIQQEAVDSTGSLLAERGLSQIARVVRDSHSNMANYAGPETVSAITFNFGWLPAGDHNIFTHAETSVLAIEAGMGLLVPGGLITLCIYYGRASGFEERDALLTYLETIDSRRFIVVVSRFVNRRNNPAIFAYIRKEPN